MAFTVRAGVKTVNKKLSIAIAVITGIVATVVLAGWLTGADVLTRIIPSGSRMVPATAIAFLLCAIALGSGATRESQALTRWLAASVVLIAACRIAVSLLGPIAAGTALDAMSPAAASNFLLLGTALLLTRHPRAARWFQRLILLVLLVGWLGLARFVYGGKPLVPYLDMAIHTATLFVLLAVGTLPLRQDAGLMALLASPGAGGVSARRLLPAAVVLPLVMAWVVAYAQRAHWLGAESGLLLLSLSSVILFSAVVWGTFALLELTDQRRRREQEALENSELRAHLIVENALDAVISIDTGGRITTWNKQAERIFGWSENEVVGEDLAARVIPERHRTSHRTGLLRLVETGVGRVLNRHLELTALDRAGREFPVELSIVALHGPKGLRFSAFVRDISARVRAEQKLRLQLERLALLDRTTRAIASRQDPGSILAVVIQNLEKDFAIDFGCACLHDSIAKTLIVNSVGARSIPLATQMEITQGTVLEIDGNGLARAARGQLVYEPDLTHLEYEFPRRLASAGLGSLVLAPLGGEGAVFGVLIAARRATQGFTSGDCEFLRQLSEHLALALNQADLYGALQDAYEDLRDTQQRMMQEERLRVLGQLASGIAHDINNALSPASLYIEKMLAQDAAVGLEEKKQLAIVQRAIEDVATTVGRMRQFYRRSETESAHAPVDLNRVIGQVIALTKARWSDMSKERGAVIEVQTDLQEDLPYIFGSDSDLRDALTNLILNAVDAMADGGTLTLRSRSIGAGRVRAEVIDTGVGMDEQTRLRCLEPFFTTKGERGTGLGLAMVYGMLERHKGEIDIQSTLGSGTRVELTFPAATHGGIAQTGLHRIIRAPIRPLRVLVIDDDPVVLTALQAILEGLGHDVVAADGGPQGIEAFCEAEVNGSPFAVVITDLGMPHCDGRKVAAAVKTVRPEIPIVLLTGWGQRMQAEGEMPEHIDRILSKPPKASELQAALAELEAIVAGS